MEVEIGDSSASAGTVRCVSMRKQEDKRGPQKEIY